MASITSLLVREVLTPTHVELSLTISRVKGYFLFGLSDLERYTRLPGVEQESIVPVLGQWTVKISSFSSRTSARNRLYLLMRVPCTSGGVNCMRNKLF